MPIAKHVPKIILILTILTVLSNGIAFSFLPAKVALQITFDGSLSNFVPKLIFVAMAPLILAIMYALNQTSKGNPTLKYFFISALVFTVNIVFLGVNL